MDMRGALRKRVLDVPLVETKVAKRVTWLTRPQASDLPAITLQLITGDRPQHLKDFERQAARVQLDSWATTTQEAADLMAACVAGLAPGGTFEGVQFSRMFFEGEIDFVDRLGSADIYRVKIDLLFQHQSA